MIHPTTRLSDDLPRSPRLRRWGAAIASLALLFGSLAPAARADFEPPDRGTPGRLEGAGTRVLEPEDFQPPDESVPEATRGACTTAINNVELPLTPLVPDNQFGVALSGYPTFLVYLPQLPQGAQLEFAVTQWTFEDGEDGQQVRDRDIYSARFDAPDLSSDGGVLALTLPEETEEGTAIAPLELEKNYTWFVRILCDPDHPTRYGPDIWVEAWVKRFEASESFAEQLDRADADLTYDLLAETGVWYDAIANLARLRADADRPERQAAWQNLLDAVALSEVADRPLLEVEFVGEFEDFDRPSDGEFNGDR